MENAMTPERQIVINFSDLEKLLEGVFHKLMKPYDDRNHEAIEKVSDDVKEVSDDLNKLRLIIAKWGGVIIAFGLLWGLFLAFVSGGGCNKLHISVDNPPAQSQNGTTHAGADLSPQ